VRSRTISECANRETTNHIRVGRTTSSSALLTPDPWIALWLQAPLLSTCLVVSPDSCHTKECRTPYSPLLHDLLPLPWNSRKPAPLCKWDPGLPLLHVYQKVQAPQAWFPMLEATWYCAPEYSCRQSVPELLWSQAWLSQVETAAACNCTPWSLGGNQAPEQLLLAGLSHWTAPLMSVLDRKTKSPCYTKAWFSHACSPTALSPAAHTWKASPRTPTAWRLGSSTPAAVVVAPGSPVPAYLLPAKVCPHAFRWCYGSWKPTPQCK
jgi:hypothetical protein